MPNLKLFVTEGNPFEAYHGSGAVILADDEDRARRLLYQNMAETLAWYWTLDQMLEISLSNDPEEWRKEDAVAILEQAQALTEATALREVPLHRESVILSYSNNC